MASRLIAEFRARGLRGVQAKVLARLTVWLRRRIDYYGEEWRFDRRFGVNTRGVRRAPGSADPAQRQALHYQGASEREFRRLVESLPGGAKELTFVDIGAGKGKALVMAADCGFHRVIGIELSTDLAEAARVNVRRYRERHHADTSFEVVCADASAYALPAEPCVLYMYNPFRAEIMVRMLENIERSLEEHPRRLIVCYQNPVLAPLLEQAPFLRRTSSEDAYAIFECTG
jgi:SAM-dependent methyltransferase